MSRSTTRVTSVQSTPTAVARGCSLADIGSLSSRGGLAFTASARLSGTGGSITSGAPKLLAASYFCCRRATIPARFNDGEPSDLFRAGQYESLIEEWFSPRLLAHPVHQGAG